MRSTLMMGAALALTLSATSVSAKPDKEQGGGQGGGNPHAGHNGGGGNAQKADRGPAKQQARQNGPERQAQPRGPAKPQVADNRGGPDRGNGQQAKAKPDRGPAANGNDRGNAPVMADNRGNDNKDVRANGKVNSDIGRRWDAPLTVARAPRGAVRTDRRGYEIVERVNYVGLPRWQPSYVNGCPPGLAKKHNGCMPPGLAKQQVRPWYGDWWRYRDDRDWNYRYDGGYLYRYSPSNYQVVSYIPLLGGALAVGQVWPSNYMSYDIPDYYYDYYGYNDRYRYRYSDGVIYGLDPETQAIQSIAALVTGDDWVVGQRMPMGYDVYNVPYGYRSQYYDTPDSWYRYDDGYVYRVDPTTQLIQAVIQLVV